jgi:hypothetical protein
VGVGDWADTKIPTMKSKEIAEMTTNFILGNFIIYPGLTKNSLISKRKRAARPTTSAALKRSEFNSSLDESPWRTL